MKARTAEMAENTAKMRANTAKMPWRAGSARLGVSRGALVERALPAFVHASSTDGPAGPRYRAGAFTASGGSSAAISFLLSTRTSPGVMP